MPPRVPWVWDERFGFAFLYRRAAFGMADVQEEKLTGSCAQGQKRLRFPTCTLVFLTLSSFDFGKQTFLPVMVSPAASL